MNESVGIHPRKLLREQIDLVGRSGEPMNVFRDAVKNRHLMPPVHSIEDNMDLAGLFYRENYRQSRNSLPHGTSSGSGEPAAPRRQSLLRSQARSALLPAATPRLMGLRR
jgi:hypothetical protein